MAVEDRIDADDEWFVGEDRDFRFAFVAGVVTDVAAWTMRLGFYPRRAKEGATPLLELPAVGHPATPAATGQPAVAAYAVAHITAAQSSALGPGLFQFVLRRTDAGSNTVLSYGPAEHRAAVSA